MLPSSAGEMSALHRPTIFLQAPFSIAARQPIGTDGRLKARKPGPVQIAKMAYCSSWS